MNMNEVETISVESQQGEQLLQEIDKMLAGNIGEEIISANFTGLFKSLATSLERLRKMFYGMIMELQVTEAQIISAREQVNTARLEVENSKAAVSTLKTGTQSINEVFRGLQGSVDSGEQLLATAVDVLEGMEGTSRSLGDVFIETNGRLENLGTIISGVDRIIFDIDNITGRVRLLSLNAAIEAAHAGEHGRGFAVVAEEMKSLSERSSQGVKETRTVITQVKDELTGAVSLVVDRQKNASEAVTHIFSNVQQCLQAVQNTMQQVLVTSREGSQQLEDYAKMVIHNLELWQNSTENLSLVTGFLGSIGESLTRVLIQIPRSIQTVNMDNQAVEQMVGELQQVAAAQGIDKLEAGLHQLKLNEILHKYDYLEAVYSNRQDGTFIHSNPPAGLVNARGRSWWKEAMDGKIHRSPVYISAITRNPCMTVAVPIVDNRRGVIGVLAADMNLKS